MNLLIKLPKHGWYEIPNIPTHEDICVEFSENEDHYACNVIPRSKIDPDDSEFELKLPSSNCKVVDDRVTECDGRMRS